MLISEHGNGCRSSASPGCDQLSPSCSPRVASSKLEQRCFIFLIIITEIYTRKKGASNQTPFFFLYDKCELTAGSDEKKQTLAAQPAGSLESLDEREKGSEHFFFFEMHEPRGEKNKKNSKMKWSLISLSVL